MTQNGVNDLYLYLAAAWPLVIKPGVDEGWKRAKMRELYQTYREYRDDEVLRAFQKWTEENDKFPTTKNIINELKWARTAKAVRGRENEKLWPMDWMDKDGNEWTWGSFKRADFVNHPRNPNRLDPEEWERRFKIQRRQWWKEHAPELTPAQEAWRQRMVASIKAYVEGGKS